MDVFIAGMGTGGTLMGVGKYLREHRAGIKIVGVEPRLGHKVQGLKNMQEAIVPEIYREELLDAKLMIKDDLAFETAGMLAVQEGLFVGMSSRAAVAGTIVTLLPDRGAIVILAPPCSVPSAPAAHMIPCKWLSTYR